MRICILGSYSGRTDEGMANVSFYLHHFLKLNCYMDDILLLNLNEILKLKFWQKLFSSQADILHFVPGPTLQGIALAKILQKIMGTKLVISATKPALPGFFKRISWLLRPDIVIVQSDNSEKLFRAVNYDTIFVPNGVDTSKFVPIQLSRKKKLREEYGFSENDFIILHIGPIRKGRNQRSLVSQFKDEKVILITSTTNQSEEDAYEELLRISKTRSYSHTTNVTIWRNYFPNIEEIYGLCDVYAFPVFEKLNSIDIPLSVLEAMSCNLPVITTNFGGLQRFLEPGSGLFYIEQENEATEIVNNLREGGIKINTRDKVMMFSWNSVVIKILEVYRSLTDR